MPKRDNFSTLTHIEEAVQRIKRWTEGISHEEFRDDELRQKRHHGEATSRLTEEFLPAHADVLPWNVMKSMRNVLIHGYDEVDRDRVLVAQPAANTSGIVPASPRTSTRVQHQRWSGQP